MQYILLNDTSQQGVKLMTQKNSTKDIYWQKIRGGCILAVIFIHCRNGVECPLDTINGLSYFIMRNLVNFPVDIFFFMAGFFVKPIDNNIAYYRKRLPKLVIPYVFYTCVYFAIRVISGSKVTIKSVIGAVFLGMASTPLYYIVVLVYFTLLTPLLFKALEKKALTVCVFLSTPICLAGGYILFYSGHDIWTYLRYTPVWLSFYFLGMYLRKRPVSFNKTVLWILLLVAFGTELASSYYLMGIEGNTFSQMRFSGMFYGGVIALLIYEYSKEKHDVQKAGLLSHLGDNSYGIYFMHSIFTMIFVKLFPFTEDMILLMYEMCELVFAATLSDIIIIGLRKSIPDRKIRMVFGA